MNKFGKVMVTMAVSASLITTPVLAAPNTDTIKQNKAEAQKQITEMDTRLQDLLVSFEVLKGDMRNQDKKIKDTNKALQAAKAKEEKQYKEMLIRIKYMYEQGETSELAALLGAESFTEMLNQMEYIQNVHTYDRKMLQEYKKSKEKVAAIKVDLEAGKADMEFMADTYKSDQKTLEKKINKMRSQVKDFDKQLAKAQKEAEEEAKRIEEETKKAEELLNAQKEEEKENNKKPTSKPSSKPSSKPTSKPSSRPQEEEKPVEKPKPEQKPVEKPQVEEKPAPEEKPSNTSKGRQIADTGLKYVGNPYVYGGNSLTEGIDCSGFTKKIHELCGIYGLARTSGDQRYGGKAVNGLANALPGDVICYDGHVAIYTGNGQIVHASNPEPYPAGGIKTGSATYRSILAIRRYW